VARKRQPHERKLRTREHVLADLSVNHVERQILLRGFAVNRPHSDYGIDLLMNTYNDHGEVESGHVLFQIRATDSLQVLKLGPLISVRVEVADLKAWQDEWMPVILVIYDGAEDKAYWLYMQQYLDERNVSGDDFLTDQDRVTVRIPLRNRVDRSAIERFRVSRDQQMENSKRNLRHGK
jgi:Domain of unknown function (DUF4365)